MMFSTMIKNITAVLASFIAVSCMNLVMDWAIQKKAHMIDWLIYPFRFKEGVQLFLKSYPTK